MHRARRAARRRGGRPHLSERSCFSHPLSRLLSNLLHRPLTSHRSTAAMARAGDAERCPGLCDLPADVLGRLADSLDLADRQAPQRPLFESSPRHRSPPPRAHPVASRHPRLSAECVWQPHAVPCVAHLCTCSATTSSSSGLSPGRLLASQLMSMWHGCAEREVGPEAPDPHPTQPLTLQSCKPRLRPGRNLTKCFPSLACSASGAESRYTCGPHNHQQLG